MLRSVENVTILETGFLPSVAQAVRAFADCLESGSIEATSAMLVTIDGEGALEVTAFGTPVTSEQAIGRLELAKAKIIAGTWR